MFLMNLISEVKPIQKYIVGSCHAMEALNPKSGINTQRVIELCGFIGDEVKKTYEANNLKGIKAGLERISKLLYQINRIVTVCEDTNNEQALSIYNVTARTRAAINEFIS